MLCVSCNIEVSPNFVSAIADNKCPACGKQLMDTVNYKQIFALKKLLIGLDLGLQDGVLTKLSAAINAKFELHIKDGSTTPVIGIPATINPEPVDATLMARQKQQMINKLSKAMDIAADQSVEIHESNENDIDEDADLSNAEKLSLMREYGLLNDTSGVNVETPTSTQMAHELTEMLATEAFPIEENSAEVDRMSRARNLQNRFKATAGINKFGIKPITRLT